MPPRAAGGPSALAHIRDCREKQLLLPQRPPSSTNSVGRGAVLFFCYATTFLSNHRRSLLRRTAFASPGSGKLASLKPNRRAAASLQTKQNAVRLPGRGVSAWFLLPPALATGSSRHLLSKEGVVMRR